MTIEELSKYHSIKVEIEQLTANIDELSKTSVGSKELTGMPHGNGVPQSPVESVVSKILKLESILEKKKSRLLDEHLKIENYLETVEDSRVRAIIRARFIDGDNWCEIGKKLAYDRTTPYYHLKKYLKEHKSEVVNNDKI